VQGGLALPLGSVNLWFPGGFQAPTVSRPPWKERK